VEKTVKLSIYLYYIIMQIRATEFAALILSNKVFCDVAPIHPTANQSTHGHRKFSMKNNATYKCINLLKPSGNFMYHQV
jgi:hypothetical protein